MTIDVRWRAHQLALESDGLIESKRNHQLESDGLFDTKRIFIKLLKANTIILLKHVRILEFPLPNRFLIIRATDVQFNNIIFFRASVMCMCLVIITCNRKGEHACESITALEIVYIQVIV